MPVSRQFFQNPEHFISRKTGLKVKFDFPLNPESQWDNETSVLLQNLSFPDSFHSGKKILMPLIIADLGFLIFCQVVLLNGFNAKVRKFAFAKIAVL